MKHIVIIVLVLIFGISSAFGQIGVNLDRPMALFHVDGAADNGVGTPAASQVINDVVFDSRGYIGVGTLNPTARLDIADSQSQGIPPLRILDGSTMSAKVLESGPNGVARWTDQPPSYTQSFTAIPGQSFTYGGGQEMMLNAKIIIPQNGRYLLTVRWWSYNVKSSWTKRPGIASIYVYLILRGTPAVSLDSIEYYMEAIQGDVITFTTSLYAGYRSQNEELFVRITPVIGLPANSHGTVQQQLSNDIEFVPQVVLYSI